VLDEASCRQLAATMVIVDECLRICLFNCCFCDRPIWPDYGFRGAESTILSANQAANRCGHVESDFSFDRCPMLKPWPPTVSFLAIWFILHQQQKGNN